jgi:hypothetical protein
MTDYTQESSAMTLHGHVERRMELWVPISIHLQLWSELEEVLASS